MKTKTIKDNIAISFAVMALFAVIFVSVLGTCFGLKNVASALDLVITPDNSLTTVLPLDSTDNKGNMIYYSNTPLTYDSADYTTLNRIATDLSNYNQSNIVGSNSTTTNYEQVLVMYLADVFYVLAATINNSGSIISSPTLGDVSLSTSKALVTLSLRYYYRPSGVSFWQLRLDMQGVAIPLLDSRSHDVLDNTTDLRQYNRTYLVKTSGIKFDTDVSGYYGLPLDAYGVLVGVGSPAYFSANLERGVAKYSDVPADYSPTFRTYGFGMEQGLVTEINTLLGKYFAFGVQTSTVVNDSTMYESGYNAGVGSMQDYVEQQQNYWYNKGKDESATSAYNAGYNAGVEDAGNYTFFSLIGAVIDAPVSAFKSMFNFEVLGVNLTSFFMAMLTASAFIIIIKIAMGGK